MQIFLSYASEDKEIAEPIAFSLRARGHKVFFDRDDLPPGGEYDIRIEKAVERSALFVFLITPDSILKGRFTLTELEFARRKWGSGDGHVLPVLAKATPLEEIPNFLKSVTILEPAGNIAAEVASAVEPLVQRLARGQMALYALAAIVSGVGTWFLFWYLDSYLRIVGIDFKIPPIRGPGFSGTAISLGQILSCAPFSIAFVLVFAYYFGFKFRQLGIFIFVLVGWFVALEVTTSFGFGTQQVAENSKCLDLTVENQGAKDENTTAACMVYWRSMYEHSEHVLNDLGAWFGAGAFGSLATAIGVPLVTRRLFSPFAAASTAIAGGVVAAAYYAGVWWLWNSPLGDTFLLLFLAWQPVVAGMVGRLLR